MSWLGSGSSPKKSIYYSNESDMFMFHGKTASHHNKQYGNNDEHWTFVFMIYANIYHLIIITQVGDGKADE